MSVLAQAESFTRGRPGAVNGCQAQCSFFSFSYRALGLPSAAGTPTAGHAAPSSIHFVRTAT